MAESGDSKTAQSTSSSKKEMSHDEIVGKFQELRQQQRSTVTKINEFDYERREHELVIDTLRNVDPSRKCYKLIGGVLVEKTVEEVLPSLCHHSDNLSKVQQVLQKQLEAKGQELQEFREKHNIRIRGEEDKLLGNIEQESKTAGGSSVLVAQASS